MKEIFAKIFVSENFWSRKFLVKKSVRPKIFAKIIIASMVILLGIFFTNSLSAKNLDFDLKLQNLSVIVRKCLYFHKLTIKWWKFDPDPPKSSFEVWHNLDPENIYFIKCGPRSMDLCYTGWFIGTLGQLSIPMD